MILYTLCVGMNPSTKQVLSWVDSEAGLRGSLDGVHPDAVEAIEGLLRARPEDRWSLAEVKQWAAQCGTWEVHQHPSCPLVRWPYRDRCPQAFGAQLPAGWSRSGETLGSLDLMRIGGVQILLIDRYSEWQKFYTYDKQRRITTAFRHRSTNATCWRLPPGTAMHEGPEATPMASTVLRERDWIYFGVKDGCCCTDVLRTVIGEKLGLCEGCDDLDSLARQPSMSSLIQFLPEFLYFAFPKYCEHAVLGQECHAAENQNALDLRRTFRINVAGLVHASGEVSWWPGASEVVQPGDGALILRAPQWDARSPIAPAVRPDDIHDLMDIGHFQQRLQLDQDHACWRAWRRNAGMRVLV